MMNTRPQAAGERKKAHAPASSKALRAVCAVGLAACLLSACGQKGPLYMPSDRALSQVAKPERLSHLPERHAPAPQFSAMRV